MIRIGVHSDQKLIVQAMGRLGEQDLVELGNQLRELDPPGAPHKAVFHLEGLKAVRPATAEPLSTPAWLRGRRFARIALVGDRRFERAARRLMARLVHGEIKYFGLGQSALARRWLDQPCLGLTPHRLLPARV